MADSPATDFALTLQTLNYAARLVASELDWERLVDRALDTLADFGQSRRVALLSVDEENGTAEVAGQLAADGLVDPRREVRLAGTPLAQIVRDKRPARFALAPGEPLPLPTSEAGEPGRSCYCVPLIGGSNRLVGLVTLDQDAAAPLADEAMQVLNVVLTLVAVTLENARLFQLATVDGLTGLYVRRYFEIRLGEELARLRRHGGTLSLIMTDIDHFKAVNDTYGHQQGDYVLRELANLLRAALRKGLDIPCRYGGEEYVTILPMTPRQGAIEVAERLRRQCERHPFAGFDPPRAVTLSAGIASIDQAGACDEEEFVRRADEMLYAAKEGGRNQVRAWG